MNEMTLAEWLDKWYINVETQRNVFKIFFPESSYRHLLISRSLRLVSKFRIKLGFKAALYKSGKRSLNRF